MAKRKNSKHCYESKVPAPPLFPVKDARRETTAKPMCDESVTNALHFTPPFGGRPEQVGQFIFQSQTDQTGKGKKS